MAGGHGRGGTPGPVPNPEVKPPSADGTAEEVRGRAGRRRPTRGVFPLTQRGPFSCWGERGYLQFPRSLSSAVWVQKNSRLYIV